MDLREYYTGWLSIPPEECPPTDLRLLNLPAGAQAAEIHQAADRLVAMLTPQLSGEHGAAALELLQQVVAARTTLLNSVTHLSQAGPTPSPRPIVVPPTAASSIATPPTAAPPQSLDEEKSLPQAKPLAPHPAAKRHVAKPPVAPTIATAPESQGQQSNRGSTVVPPGLPNSPVPIVVDSGSSKHASDDSRYHPPTKKSPTIEALKIVGGGLAGVLIAALILHFAGISLFSTSKKETPSPEVAESNKTAKQKTRSSSSEPETVPSRPESPATQVEPADPGIQVDPPSPNEFVPETDYAVLPDRAEDLVVTAPKYVFTP